MPSTDCAWPSKLRLEGCVPTPRGHQSGTSGVPMLTPRKSLNFGQVALATKPLALSSSSRARARLAPTVSEPSARVATTCWHATPSGADTPITPVLTSTCLPANSAAHSTPWSFTSSAMCSRPSPDTAQRGRRTRRSRPQRGNSAGTGVAAAVVRPGGGSGAPVPAVLRPLHPVHGPRTPSTVDIAAVARLGRRNDRQAAPPAVIRREWRAGRTQLDLRRAATSAFPPSESIWPCPPSSCSSSPGAGAAGPSSLQPARKS